MISNQVKSQKNIIHTVNEVSIHDIYNLRINSEDVSNKAMELTDSWGQAMFVMDPSLVKNIFSTIGFSDAVCDKVYEGIKNLAYVENNDKTNMVTWHSLDATCMTIRGIVNLSSAMSKVDNSTVESYIQSNAFLFKGLMNVMPSYAQDLMFSPDVASVVLKAFGAEVSSDRIYELAAKYGNRVTKDLDGRRGVPTQFIRSLTLTISATIN